MSLSAAFEADGGGTGGGGDGDPYNQDCPPTGCDSPIILNLGIGNYQLTNTNDAVLFDLNADGAAERIAWTAGGASMAFLALDRNGNGLIDDGSELFGNHTPLARGGLASNGFVALAENDQNGDAAIDASDPLWNSLLLWIDWNHNGISESGELEPISHSNVTAINLAYHWSGRVDGSGNTYRYQATCRIGGSGRPCYDIFLLSVP